MLAGSSPVDFAAREFRSRGRRGVTGSAVVRTRVTVAPISSRRGLRSFATRSVMSPSVTGVPLPILNQRSSIFAQSPPMCPGSMAMWRLARGFPGGGMGSSSVDFQVRGAGSVFSGVEKRRMKTGSVG